jgi:hypothetical protein
MKIWALEVDGKLLTTTLNDPYHVRALLITTNEDYAYLLGRQLGYLGRHCGKLPRDPLPVGLDNVEEIRTAARSADADAVAFDREGKLVGCLLDDLGAALMTYLRDDKGEVITADLDRYLVLGFLKDVPDGKYSVTGPGIDATYCRIDGLVYPTGGILDGVPFKSLFGKNGIESYNDDSK